MTKKFLFKIGTTSVLTMSAVTVVAACTDDTVVKTYTKEVADKEVDKVQISVKDKDTTLATQVTKSTKFNETGFDTGHWQLEVKDVSHTSDGVTVKFVIKSKVTKVVSKERTVQISGFLKPNTLTTFKSEKVSTLFDTIKQNLEKGIGKYTISKINTSFNDNVEEDKRKNISPDEIKWVIDETSLVRLKAKFFNDIKHYITMPFEDHQVLDEAGSNGNAKFVYIIDFDKKEITGKAGNRTPVKVADITEEAFAAWKKSYIDGLLLVLQPKVDTTTPKPGDNDTATGTPDANSATSTNSIDSKENQIKRVKNFGEASFKELLKNKWEITLLTDGTSTVKFFYEATEEVGEKLKKETNSERL